MIWYKNLVRIPCRCDKSFLCENAFDVVNCPYCDEVFKFQIDKFGNLTTSKSFDEKTVSPSSIFRKALSFYNSSL